MQSPLEIYLDERQKRHLRCEHTNSFRHVKSFQKTSTKQFPVFTTLVGVAFTKFMVLFQFSRDEKTEKELHDRATFVDQNVR